MDFGKLVEESFGYAKDGLVGHWLKWIILIVLALLPAIPVIAGIIMGYVSVMAAPSLLIPTIIVTIILAILFALPLMGYMMRIYRGVQPAPEVDNWGALFNDGFKLFVAYLVYGIPIIIIGVVVFGSAGLALIVAATQKGADPGSMMGLIGAVLFGMVILALVWFIIWLIVATAVIRLARTNSIAEAFNFGEIFNHIGKIGTANYIFALIIMVLIIMIVTMVLNWIPLIGWILVLIVAPFLTIFQARYICLLYDSVGTA